MGYRNPPEVKPQGIAGNLQPMTDPAGYPPVTEGYRPPVWIPTVTSSSSSSPVAPLLNRDDECNKNQLEASNTLAFSQGQYANTHLGNELQYDNTALPSPPHSLPSVPHSLPSVPKSISPTDGSDTSTQLGSLPHTKFYKQKSVPNDESLSGSMAAVATGPTNSIQLAVSDGSPVMANVPLPDRPTPEAYQAPFTADSKYGKTNLNYLKDKLQHKKEVTQTMVQAGFAVNHRQLISNYVSNEILAQGVPESANKPTVGKTDLTSLRSRLEKTKEEREKTVIGVLNTKTKPDYYNMLAISVYAPENPVIIRNPADKKPVAGPRTKASANLASSNTHSASSKRTYRLWQCAQCQEINEAQHASCKNCKLPRRKMADMYILCAFCQLMIFIPATKGVLLDISCLRCKQVHEAAF